VRQEVKRSKRLEPVRDLMDEVERKSAVRMSGLQSRLADAERSYTELEGYLREYQHSFQSRASAGMSVGGVREHMMFIARLNEAVQQQRLLVAQLRAECEQEHGRWAQAAVRKHAVRKVLAQARQEDKQLEERRAQMESDERAQNRAGGQ
jgi:flagellar export protein FliJ